MAASSGLREILTLIICIGYLPKDGSTETRGVGVLRVCGDIRGCAGVLGMTPSHGLLTHLKFVPSTEDVGWRGWGSSARWGMQ